jgi:hypothetical protein
MSAPRFAAAGLLLASFVAVSPVQSRAENSLQAVFRDISNAASSWGKRFVYLAASGAMAPAPADFGIHFDPKIPPELRALVNSDLSFVRSIRGSGASNLHRQVFGAVNGQDYISFFAARVKKLNVGDDCRTYVTSYVSGKDRAAMQICGGYLQEAQIGRIDTIFHEARHAAPEAANGYWRHTACPTPFYAKYLEGMPACDASPVGSYGIARIMLKNIEKYCVNCTDKSRLDAALYSDDDIQRIIDKPSRRLLADDLPE